LRWGELTVRLWDEGTPHDAMAVVAPTNVDMGKVSAAMKAVDGLAARTLEPGAVQAMPEGIRHSPTGITARFIMMAGAGVRRWLASISGNPL
jgi:hypothetical protein